jgi:hypothetical protein
MDTFAEYETTVDTPPDTGETLSAPEASEPAVDETPVAEETAAEEPWQLSRDDWEATQYALSQIAQQYQQPAVQQQPLEEGRPPEYDPFDPQSVAAYNEWERQQTLTAIQEMISPLATRAQQEAEQEQASLLKDAAVDVETRKGEFLGDEPSRSFAREQMLAAARDALPELAQRYGMTDRAAELALEQGYQQVKAYQDAIAKAAIERHTNEISTLAGAPQDPAGGGTGLRVTPKVYGDERDLARSWAARA